MNSFLRPLLAALFVSLATPALHAQSDPATQPWWRGPASRTLSPFPDYDIAKLPLIRVAANHFVDPDGNVILFRGVSIADPDKIDGQRDWNRQLFQQVHDFGAKLVRIPVHPAAWRQQTPQKYLALLDQAVRWCTELNMHVIIDWHSIGNLHMELFQEPMYDTTQKETYEFWRTVARHFRGNHTVAFYEIFNEPTTFSGQLGSVSWAQWKEINENIIHLIRAYDGEKIPLVAGFDWAYDLTPLREQPIDAEGIGYVTHPYPMKRTQPWEPKWDEDFGFAAQRYPMIATEIGFQARPNDPAGPSDYGNRITRYLEGHGISWVAWCFDPEWGPTLLKSWDFDLSGSGEFFKMAMRRPVGGAK